MDLLPTPVDGLACGACCFSQLPTYVQVTGEDLQRLGDRAEDLAHFIGHRAYLRMTDGHGAALAIRRRADGGPEYFCTVYDRRPQICRDLDRGSPSCAGEISAKLARAQAAGRMLT